MLPHATVPSPSSRRLFTAALACLGITAACSGVPLTAPSGTAITLVASTNTLSSEGSTDITAVLIEGAQSPPGQNGTPTDPINGVGTPVHNGTVVTFLTTLGRIEPSEAKTQGGQAKVTLIGDGRSGVATITAFSGGSSQTLEISIGGAAAEAILLSATPQSLPPGGGTATIEARVIDDGGNGLSGVPITFSTTAGSLAPASATTNAAGIATTTLTATRTATISASAGGVTAESIDVSLGARTTISIAPPATINVSTPATFTVSVSSTASDPAVVTDAVINFGDGSDAPLGTLVGTGPQTVLHLYASQGLETVTVSGKDGDGNPVSRSTQVAVGPLTATGTAATFGNVTRLTVTVLPSNALIQSYSWDFGDGTNVTTASPAVDHVYGTSGTKSIRVTVVPVAGAPFEIFLQAIIA